MLFAFFAFAEPFIEFRAGYSTIPDPNHGSRASQPIGVQLLRPGTRSTSVFSRYTAGKENATLRP